MWALNPCLQFTLKAKSQVASLRLSPQPRKEVWVLVTRKPGIKDWLCITFWMSDRKQIYFSLSGFVQQENGTTMLIPISNSSQ